MVNKNTTRCSASLVIQFRSVTQSYLPLCDPMNCSTPGLPVHHQLSQLAQTHVHLVDDAIKTAHPLLSHSSPPSMFPSIGVFSKESVLYIRGPEYWSFSFNMSPSNEYSGLIFFRVDWFDPLAVQGTLSSPTSQFRRISSSALSFLCSPALTSIHNYWKTHSFD